MIDSLCSQNNYGTYSRKYFKKDIARKRVHNEGDDSIVSQQKSVFLVQSHLCQEYGLTTMVDNIPMIAPAQFTIGTKHTENTVDTTSKYYFDKE